MAKSNAHRWGQIIGDVFESATYELLRDVASEHNLYLDSKGPRKTRRGRLVKWQDVFGNSHDLDYVLERGGTDESLGVPVAFIETAWRKYTKHSKAKAQEIEAALSPLSVTYQDFQPFLGCVLSGEFTYPSLAQLRSKKFHVIHWDSNVVFDVFRSVSINAASDEQTEEAEFAHKITAWNQLTGDDLTSLKRALISSEDQQIEEFLEALNAAISRRVRTVSVIPLHGIEQSFSSIQDAVELIRGYGSDAGASIPLNRFEMRVQYTNGDSIRGDFAERAEAVRFLESFL